MVHSQKRKLGVIFLFVKPSLTLNTLLQVCSFLGRIHKARWGCQRQGADWEDQHRGEVQRQTARLYQDSGGASAVQYH